MIYTLIYEHMQRRLRCFEAMVDIAAASVEQGEEKWVTQIHKPSRFRNLPSESAVGIVQRTSYERPLHNSHVCPRSFGQQ